MRSACILCHQRGDVRPGAELCDGCRLEMRTAAIAAARKTDDDRLTVLAVAFAQALSPARRGSVR